MTGKGTVILARVDPRWVLAVLFEADFQLGGALSRTKAVVDLLMQVDLPPPPSSIVTEEEEVREEDILPVEEEVMVGTDSTIPEESQDLHLPESMLIEPKSVTTEMMPTEAPEKPLEDVEVDVRHGCVVHRAENYKDSMTLDSALNIAVKKQFANVGIDILLIVDEKMTVYKLAEHLSRPVEKIIQIVKWCVAREILWVECPEEQEPSHKEIIELPLFEGNIDKVKKQHRPVLQLCDGKKTLQEIATELGIPYFEALQIVVPYRGKTVKFIRTDKASRF